MTSSPAPACNSCRIDLVRTGAIRMKKCKHRDSRTRVGWAVCSDGDDAVIQEGGGRCGWHFLYVWTSTFDQGKALPFPWIWDNGVLNTALLMSWILIHRGYTCSPHEPRVKMTDLKTQKDGPFLRESNVTMLINGSGFGEVMSGCCGQKKCGQEIMSLCSPQKS